MQGIMQFYQFVRSQQSRLLYIGFALTLIASLLDGCSIVTLLPLLHFTQIGSSHASSHFMGVTLSLSTVMLFFLLILLLCSVIRYASAMFNTRLNMRFANDYRSLLFNTVSQTQWAYLKTLKSGYLSNMLTMAIQNMSFSCSQLLMLLSNIIFCIVYVMISCYFNFMLTSLSVGVGALLFCLLRLWDKYFIQQGQMQYQAFTELTQKINEFISSIKLTKLYGQQEYQNTMVRDLSEQFNAPVLSYARINSLNQAGYLIGGGAAFVLILYCAVFYLHVAFTTLVVMLYIFSRLVTRLNTIHTQYRMILKVTPVFNDTQAFIARCSEHAQCQLPPAAIPLSFQREVILSDIAFSYSGAARPVLKNFNLRLPFGCLTHLTGPSGCGKSTAMDVVCGLLQPQQGMITVDGVELSAGNLAAWQQQIGYVPQESVFFHDSVRANLFCQSGRFTDQQLVAALSLAQAWAFVKRLPKQLDTVIGPNGFRLSGGERQRLALARALLLRPSLLILDEATNALDHDNEGQFLQAIRALTPSLTILMISHQPHLSAVADYRVQMPGCIKQDEHERTADRARA